MTNRPEKSSSSHVPPQNNPVPPLPFDAKLWQRVAASLDLSPQHTRAVGLLLRGLCNKQIADAMGIAGIDARKRTSTTSGLIPELVAERPFSALCCKRLSHELRDREMMS